METGSVPRPPVAGASGPAPRLDSLPPASTVKTDLRPEAAVQPVTQAEAVRFEPSDGARTRAAIDAALRETIDRHLDIDPKTRQVVYQEVNGRTGEVVRQVPEETLLKLRAFAREMRGREDGEQPSPARIQKTA